MVVVEVVAMSIDSRDQINQASHQAINPSITQAVTFLSARAGEMNRFLQSDWLRLARAQREDPDAVSVSFNYFFNS